MRKNFQIKKTPVLLTIILLAMFFTHPFTVFGADAPEIVADTAVLLDVTTGEILYDKNMHKQKFPASTTKMMTGILAIENMELDEMVVIDALTPFSEGTRIFVLEGEIFTTEQLLYALLMESANDAAVALAKAIAGSTESFVEIMNQKAKEYGAINTNFNNPNGLPDENHLTTAYDLAMIAKYAMQNEKFSEIVVSLSYRIPATNMQSERNFYTKNRLLNDTKTKFNYRNEKISAMYEGATGIKTGYTKASDSCFVASAERDGRELIAVVMQSNMDNVFLDAIKLFDYGFENFKNVNIGNVGEDTGNAAVRGGKENEVATFLSGNILITLANDVSEGIVEIKKEFNKELKAPISEGMIVGTYSAILDGNLLGSAQILSLDAVEKSIIAVIFEKISSFFNMIKIPVLLVIGILVILVIIFRIYLFVLENGGKIRRRPRYKNSRGSELKFAKKKRRKM